MKVSVEKEYRRLYTMEDLDNARALIAALKEDTSKPADYLIIAAGIAARMRGDYAERILEASAETAKNCRLEWNAQGDNTGIMDAWISGTAETSRGFLKIGAYLSDIWNISGDDYAAETAHMYIRYYTEQ